MIIFIRGNVPSLKNSRTVRGGKGSFPSKTVRRYLAAKGIQKFSSSRKEVTGYKTRPDTMKPLMDQIKAQLVGKEYPVKIGLHFVRDSKRDFDFHNACQIIADLMVAYDVIPDDSMKYFLPFPFKVNKEWYGIDKEEPGVYIKIY